MSQDSAPVYAVKAVKRVANPRGYTYIVFKTVKRHPSVLRGKTNRHYYRKYTSINLYELLSSKCVDEEFERHMNMFLSEEEFKELMKKYIRKCFKSNEAIARRLEKLEEFINEPAKVAEKKKKEKQYPAVSDYEKQYYVLRAILNNAIDKYEFDEVEVYLFEKSFCVLSTDYDTAIFLPYDAEIINIEAISKLGEREVYVLGKASRSVEESLEDGIEEGQDIEGRLKNALDIINFTIMVYEMLKR